MLLRIKKMVNEQLEAEVMTCSSNESKTSHVVAANLSELEPKKILIDKMERNKRREDEDKDEEPSARSNRRSKRRRASKEPESTSAPKEKTTKPSGKSNEGSKSSHKSAGQSTHAEEPMQINLRPLTFLIECGVKCWKSARDVYSKRIIIAVTKLEIVDWHDYKHLDWITIRRVDDKLYQFKEGDFNKLRIQDIEDMLLLLVQGKLTNLIVEERLAFNVSLIMFTRSIVIQRRVEDLQLRNKDKKNRLMRIDELHKFSDGTLNDVRTALNDRLKGIRMEYLPQTIWRQSDKDKAGAMI
ncbi:hypothetical protein Tco_0765629 [Tanacetum coccineum]